MDPVPLLEHPACLPGYMLDTVESIPAENATVRMEIQFQVHLVLLYLNQV